MPIYPPVPSWLDLVYRVSPKMRKLERKDCQLIKCDGDMAAGALSDWSSSPVFQTNWMDETEPGGCTIDQSAKPIHIVAIVS